LHNTMDDAEANKEIERHAKLGPALAALLRCPSEAQECPFCGAVCVQAKWSLYSVNPRAASLTVWCSACAQHALLAVPLPDYAPDEYPPGFRDEVAEQTLKVFRIGRRRRWW